MKSNNILALYQQAAIRSTLWANHQSHTMCPILTKVDKSMSKFAAVMIGCDIRIRNLCWDTKPEDHVWIEFDSVTDFTKFMYVLFHDPNFDSDIHLRAHFKNESKWLYNCTVKDPVNLNNPLDYKVLPSVKIPYGDYSWIYQRIAEFWIRNWLKPLGIMSDEVRSKIFASD